ncbi:alpha/beta hydrolase [Gigaspora margarita]|uniref:Alpha/beta hydrolase n=1 Tax=Gigaspora margarita TaxID=4874 RepID=A0A8H3XPG2_GIGMA|nr:alpha/beta hydrolase [Gigaspora margarita]
MNTVERSRITKNAPLNALSQYLSQLHEGDFYSSLESTDIATIHLTKSECDDCVKVLWNNYVNIAKKERVQEHLVITKQDASMPIWFKTFGSNPFGEKSLFISLHGGGNVEPHVNDSQWENQKNLYTIEEGVYLAPRAPGNTWDLWHRPEIDHMFDRIIENMIIFEGVNPNKVYLTGYSAGGDGVYKLAPRTADRWAAANANAGHPNDASPLGLRNTPFTIHVGANDVSYNRNKVGQEWADKLAKLHNEDSNGYIHLVKIYDEMGHHMNRKEKAAPNWMAQYTRNPIPDRVVWLQDSVTHDRFFWLELPENQIRQYTKVIATRDGQNFGIQTKDYKRVTILLNDTMVDMDFPVKITMEEKVLFEGIVPRTIGAIARSLKRHGDPYLIFTGEVTVCTES